jgi:hypothetical protein
MCARCLSIFCTHGSELVLNSVEHMGTGIVKPQDDAFCPTTVTFAVLQLVKHLRVTIYIILTEDNAFL